MTSTFTRLAAGTALALSLTGAGATAAVASPAHAPASTQISTEQHTKHDHHFAVMMIPHHQGAIDMAELAVEKSDRPEIRELAETIVQAQSAEIEQLQAAADRLAAENDAEHHGHHHGHHHHGHHGGHGHGGEMDGDMMGEMDGMSPDELAELSGDEFDRAFLEEMITHHRMAVEMAEMELQMGTDPELRAMAETMIEDQQAEITLMRGWLAEWFAA
ncbi:DUF305 domain-containing protein [Kocuria sediminis]|nr:DUF305 domain-containing protein [Kocuria sediminis]